MIPRFFGIDIHKHYGIVAAVDAEQQVIMSPTRVAMADLPQWAADHLTGDDQVVLEVGTNTWRVVEILNGYAGKVIVANPYQTKLIAQARIKNDKVDAMALAHLLAARFIPEVWIPDTSVQEQRSLAAHRATLQKQCTQVTNRVHYLLTKHNLHCPVPSLFSVAGRQWLASLALPPADQLQLGHLLRQLEVLEVELDETDRLIARLASQDPRVPYLMQLTGVNYYTAFSILAAIGDVERFSSPDQLTAYGGLVPRQHQSGAHNFYGHITKAGNSQLRWLVIEAARSAVRWDPHWRKIHDRIARRRGSQIATVAVGRRLLALTWHLLTNQETYRYLQGQTLVTKLQQWAIRIGRAYLPATSSSAFVRRHLLALGLHDLVASLTTNKKGQLRVQVA